MSELRNQSRVAIVREYVVDFMAEKFSAKICYHNLEHTQDVVEACELIGTDCGLTKEEHELLRAAAWLHDIGYYAGYKNHEETSAVMAKNFLLKNGWSNEEVVIIANCILATKVPQQPKTLLEQIICDADLFHLATDRFNEKSELLWREFSVYDKNLTEEQWRKTSREFVTTQKYFTHYGKTRLEPKLKENIRKFIDKPQ